MKKDTSRKWVESATAASNAAGGGLDAAPAQPCQTAPWWVKVFVPFHILAITIYCLPQVNWLMDGKIKPKGTDWILYVNQKYARNFPPVEAYCFATGFWQYWDMFAPDPVQTDQYCTATVVYKDGTSRFFQYPRMYLLSIPQKFLQERYRKFYERAHDYYGNPKAQEGFVAQRFAQRIALINDTNPANPPVEIQLYIHEWKIPPPGKKLDPQYTSKMYFDYFVDQKLLTQDKDGTP